MKENKEMDFAKELANLFKKHNIKPETANEFYKIVTRAIAKPIQSALIKELNTHLGHEKNKVSSNKNSRNGYSTKRIKGSFGEIEMLIPCDRDGAFEPQIIKKH